MTLYRATGLRPGRARPEEDEHLEMRAFRRAALTRMMQRGTLRDGKSLVGILLHRQHLRRTRRAPARPQKA